MCGAEEDEPCADDCSCSDCQRTRPRMQTDPEAAGGRSIHGEDTLTPDQWQRLAAIARRLRQVPVPLKYLARLREVADEIDALR